MQKFPKIQKHDLIILLLCILIILVSGYIFTVNAQAEPFRDTKNYVKRIFSGTSGVVTSDLPLANNNSVQVPSSNTPSDDNAQNVPQNSTSGSSEKPTPPPAPSPSRPEHVTEVLSKTSSLTYNAWDWDEGVALQGMVNYADAASDSEVRNSAMKIFSTLAGKAPKDQGSVLLANQAILGEAALVAYQQTKDEKYLRIATTLGQALLNWSALAPNGAFLHYYPKYCSTCDNKNYVWSDTLYMTVPFMVRLSEVTGNTAYLQKAASQVVLHGEYLQDANGLIHHASKADGKTNEFQFWARANGWFAGSAAAVLVDLPKSDANRAKIEGMLRKQMSALRTYQDGGLWHTVVNHSETYKESSGSALITFAMLKALRLGVLDTSFKQAAKDGVDAVQGQISSSGVLQNTSAGTSPSSQVAYYQSIAHSDVQLYGQGAYLNMMGEWVIAKK